MAHKILIVDDNADMREIMQVYLSGYGFTVFVAKDGIAGIETAHAEHPDVIVTDARMPRLDGIKMVRQLRAQPQTSNVPVIIVTGIDSEQRDAAQEAGADRVLSKPVSPSELLSEIQVLIGSDMPSQPQA